MSLRAIARPGSVARVSQDNGVEDARGARQRDILKTLQQTRQVDVTELAQRFGVSGMTIRRDLAELDEAGQLHRVHGGAIIRRAPAYGSRASTQAGEKAAIARIVAEPGHTTNATGPVPGSQSHDRSQPRSWSGNPSAAVSAAAPDPTLTLRSHPGLSVRLLAANRLCD